MKRVRLNTAEILIAAIAGLIREVMNIGNDVTERIEQDKNAPSWQMHITGAIGEFVLAKALNVFPHNLFRRGAVDVDGWQVRTTEYLNGHLPIKKDRDNDNDRFVLIVGKDRDYTVVGWVYAHEGKKPEFWRGDLPGRPAYFVPQSILREMPWDEYERERHDVPQQEAA